MNSTQTANMYEPDKDITALVEALKKFDNARKAITVEADQFELVDLKVAAEELMDIDTILALANKLRKLENDYNELGIYHAEMVANNNALYEKVEELQEENVELKRVVRSVTEDYKSISRSINTNK